MRALVVYESMFGATHAIADAIAEGLAPTYDVTVSRAAETANDLNDTDLVVVGAPTHVHGLSRSLTRRGAPDYVAKSHGKLTLEPGADAAPGVREWLDALPSGTTRAAAFDTRIHARAALTGRAASAIARKMKRHGLRVVTPPESFLVTKASLLEDGEIERARRWGGELASRVR